MRYLLINSLKFGGAEKVAQILSDAGVFDKIITLEDEQDFPLGVPIMKLSGHTQATSSALKTIFIPVYAWRLRRILRGGDVVVSFIERANFVNICAKIISGHKAVIALHTNISSSFKTLKKYPYYLLIKMLYPRADAVISVSKGINDDFKRIISFKRYNSVIYNPIDLISVNSLKSEVLGFSDELMQNSLITVGRLFYQKAQWTLLKTFSGLLGKIPGAKLFIIGDGDLRGQLLAYAAGLGLKVFSVFSNPIAEIDSSYDVYFLGFQKNPYKFMARATVFVLSSVSEGMPMVVLEAMACGLPVVSSDCNYGPREILLSGGKKFGLLVPVLDYKISEDIDTADKGHGEWLEAFSGLLNDEEKRREYQELSLARAEDFSISQIKAIWRELFEKIEDKKE
ncbi:MAG: glycosyltransferase [Patescibacteria group bacterium]|jgi:glycosyltransferase involved in cell wall biosynthesis